MGGRLSLAVFALPFSNPPSLPKARAIFRLRAPSLSIQSILSFLSIRPTLENRHHDRVDR